MLKYDDLVKSQQGQTREQMAQIAQAATLPAPQQQQPYSPLPQLAPQGASTMQQQPQGDPITIFNQELMKMLKESQSMSNAPLANEANRLDLQQTQNSMGSATSLGIQGLAPGDALNARKNAGGVYDPAVKNLEERQRLNNESIGKFESAIKAAKDFGDGYDKYVKADDATVEAVRNQMAAGFVPSATVLDKVGKFLTADDWNGLSEAKKTTDSQPNSYQEYKLTTSTPTPEGYAKWLDRDSKYKGDGDGTDETNPAKEEARVKQIISIHPGQWGDAADQIDREFPTATGLPKTSTKYDALLKKAFVDEDNSNPFE